MDGIEKALTGVKQEDFSGGKKEQQPEFRYRVMKVVSRLLILFWSRETSSFFSKESEDNCSASPLSLGWLLVVAV